MKQLCRSSLALQFFTVAYLLGMFHVLPVLKYYPTLHLWDFASIKGEPGMSWFAYTAYGLIAAAAGYVAGAPYAKLQERLKFDLAVPSACVAGLAFIICTIAHEASRW